MTRLRYLFCLLSLVSGLYPTVALAQPYPPGCEPGANPIRLGVPIGGVTELPRGEGAFRCYVLIFYRYLIGVAVILASVVVTWAGYVWLTSGGDPSRIQYARELITGALSGLALLLLASVAVRLIGIR